MPMSDPKAFIDTNIFFYLFSDDTDKANQAEEIVRVGGRISVQVLNEFANVARRKLAMPWKKIREVLTLIRLICLTDSLTIETHDRGMAVAERYRLSVYDSMIVAAALIARRKAMERIAMMDDAELLTLKIFNTWDPVEGKNFWEAIIEIPADCSLFDFHRFIQDITDFDNDHLFEFYAGRNERNRKLLFSEEPGYPDNGGEFERILLKDIYPLKKSLKLYYLFDFGDDWIFEIHKLRKKAIPQEGVQYPRVVSQTGNQLIQYSSCEDD